MNEQAPKSNTIDVETLKFLMMAFSSPTKTAETPIVHTKDDALMNADIARIKDDVKEIRDTLKDINKTYVPIVDHNQRINYEDKVFTDYENRIRANETQNTRTQTWGTAALILITIAQFALQFFRHTI